MKRLRWHVAAWLLCLSASFSAPQTSIAEDEARPSFTDMHAAVERSYRRTKLRGHTEQGYLQARGRPIRVADQNHLGMNGILEYYPFTEKDESTGRLSSQIIVSMKVAETLERDSSSLAYIRRDNSGYRWTSYSVQYQAGDTIKEISLPPREAEPEHGLLRPGKKITIPLGTAQLLMPLRHGSAIFVTLQSDTSPTLRMTIPFSYLVGYATKASEHGLIGANDAALVTRLHAAIKAKSAR